MAFSLDKFLKPISPGDRVLQIYNDGDALLYSINPFSITNTQVQNNIIKISLKSLRVITLDFLDTTTAKSAIVLLQSNIEILKNNKPFLIDKQIEGYVEEKISGFTGGFGETGAQGVTGPRGITGPQGPRGITGPIGPEIVKVGPNPGQTNFVPRWVSGETLSSTGSIYDDGSKIYIGTFSGNHILNIVGTISTTDIIPNRDYTDPQGGFSLGSPTERWENIYVKDAFVASQSIYLDDLKLSTAGNYLIVGDRGVNKYEGISRTYHQIGNIGEIITLEVEKDLTYVKGDSIKVQNTLPNHYETPGYSEESVYLSFIGEVDGYRRDLGLIDIVLSYTEYSGSTSSFWYLKLNSDLLGFENDIVQISTASAVTDYFPKWTGGRTLSSTSSLYENVNGVILDNNLLPSLDLTWNLGSSSSRWNSIYVASQSIFLGDTKLTSDKEYLIVDGRGVNKYESVVNEYYEIGQVGEYLQFNIEKDLTYVKGDSIKVQNILTNNYETPGYSELGNYGYFVATVDGYRRNDGIIDLVITYTQNTGFTSSVWYLKLNSDILGFENKVLAIDDVSAEIDYFPKWVGGKTLSSTSSIYESATGIIVNNNIIPSDDYTWSLGTSQSRWNNIYVKDALVASQSLYLDQTKLSSVPGYLIVDERGVNKYESISYEYYQIGAVGEYLQFNIEKDLTYVKGDSIKVQNTLPDNYEEPGYSEGTNYGYFIAQVDGYRRDTGLIDLIITYTEYTGFTSSVWYLKLNSDILGFENSLKNLRLVGTSSTEMTIPQIGDIREIYTQINLGFYTGQEVIVYSDFFNNYEDPEYAEDGDANYFIGKVDFYYPETGLLTVVTDYTVGSGTYSLWQITVSSLPGLGTTASFEELIVTGTTTLQQVVEVLTTATPSVGLSSSTFDLDLETGSIFYIEPDGSDFVANYMNVPTTDNRIISTTIIMSQTASAYIPSSVVINGYGLTISWANASLPSGNANQTDIVGFSFMRIGGTWSKVFGQLSTFATI